MGDLLQQCSSLQGPIDALSNIDPVNPDHYNHDAIMKISTLEQQYATCQASKTLLLNAWCRNDESFPQDHKNKLFNLATAFFENDATELETQAARVQDAMGVHPCVEDGGDDDNLFDQVQNAVEKCSEAGNGNTATAASRRIKSLVEGHLDFLKAQLSQIPIPLNIGGRSFRLKAIKLGSFILKIVKGVSGLKKQPPINFWIEALCWYIKRKCTRPNSM